MDRPDGVPCWRGGGGGGLPGIDTSAMKELIVDPNAIAAGAVRPPGRAVRCDGGYCVSGRWPFVSGCNHATWIVGACVVYKDDAPKLDGSGKPEIIYCYFPKSKVEIIDTWLTTGLRG